MKTLRFEGYSDDTFGETMVTKDDYDNCASGEPIEYLITAASEPGAGLVVTGQYCPGRSGSWLVGIVNYDPNSEDADLPSWNAHFAPSYDKFRGSYSPVLLIDVPDDFVLRCLSRESANDE